MAKRTAEWTLTNQLFLHKLDNNAFDVSRCSLKVKQELIKKLMKVGEQLRFASFQKCTLKCIQPLVLCKHTVFVNKQLLRTNNFYEITSSVKDNFRKKTTFDKRKLFLKDSFYKKTAFAQL